MTTPAPVTGSFSPTRLEPSALRIAGGWAALVLASVALTGCYTYAPLRDPEPRLGESLAFELAEPLPADVARGVGPETTRVEGTLVRRTDTDFIVSVSQAVTTRGRVHRWNGETVSLPQAYIRRVQTRRFSAPRTVLVAGGAALSFVAFVVTRSLLGGGGTGEKTKPLPDDGDIQ